MVFAYQASLQAKDLSCQRDQRSLFNQLNFELVAGEILLLDGSNGCGKTTLLKILCGFRQADSGALFWNGIEITDTDYLNTLAFVGHSNGHKQELTVSENLTYYQALRKPGHHSLDEALESMKLDGIKDRGSIHNRVGN
jgi:heme exporter protein A